MKSYDLDLIKARLPEYLARIGVTVCHLSDNRLRANCPLHADSKPSFTADFKDGVWVWKCWPCDLGGTVIDLHADLNHLARRSKAALAGTASILGLAPTDGLARRKAPHLQPGASATRKEAPPKTALPANFDQLHRLARRRVYEFPRIQQAIAKELGVSQATIASLVFTTDALGWSKKHQRPLYLYETGVKLRNHADAKVRFQWLMGRAEKPWRAHFLERPQVTRVFLTEGESDTIALIDAGLENLHPKDGETGTTIMASPGTSFKAEWAKLLTGKDLVLCMDNDKAGNKAAEKIANLCQPFTRTISRFQWPVANHQS